MPVFLYFPTKVAPTTTITLRASNVSFTRKENRPVGQTMEIAASGREYVRKISSNQTDTWPMDIQLLPSADEGSNQGKDSLQAFIQTTLDYMMNTCEVEDPEGNLITARYVRGLESLREEGGAGQTRTRAEQWSGTIIWRKTL